MTDDERIEVRLSEAAPPPWVDEAYDDEAAELLRDHVDDLIEAHADELGPMTIGQATAVRIVMMKAASWGWDAAMNIGPMAQRYASPAAAEAKKAQKAERYAAIRAAFERITAAGQEPDIDKLAAEFAVSRPTVYRALRPTE
jgi:AraC-like DNA-binding protein